MRRIAPRMAMAATMAGALAWGPLAPGQQRNAATSNAEASMMVRALRANPVTAGYPIQVHAGGPKLVMRGRVGNRAVYDTTIAVAISTGIPFKDELVIDTAVLVPVETTVVSPMASQIISGPLPPFPPTYTTYGYGPAGTPSYVYPPPVMGFVDEPFFGFEPPVISYPPWWQPADEARAQRDAVDRARALAPAGAPAAALQADLPAEVELSIDPRGVGLLRGRVANLEDRIAVGQRLAAIPGVREVINQLEIDPSLPPIDGSEHAVPAPPAARPPIAAGPPAPPRPAPALAGPPTTLGAAFDADPELGPFRLKARVDRGVATIDGDVPTVMEAMKAHLMAGRFPGVTSVVDRLRFRPPVDGEPNPLIGAKAKGDVESYLLAQLKRQSVKGLDVERVSVAGEVLEVHGTIQSESGRDRAEASLRSTPLLRGFQIVPRLRSEAGEGD